MALIRHQWDNLAQPKIAVEVEIPGEIKTLNLYFGGKACKHLNQFLPHLTGNSIYIYMGL